MAAGPESPWWLDGPTKEAAGAISKRNGKSKSKRGNGDSGRPKEKGQLGNKNTGLKKRTEGGKE